MKKHFFTLAVVMALAVTGFSQSLLAVEYTAASLRDPFGAKQEASEGAISGMDKSSPSSLSLDGILWSGPRPCAIINKKIVRVGDVLAGAEILEISKDGVKLSVNGEEKVLSQKKDLNP